MAPESLPSNCLPGGEAYVDSSKNEYEAFRRFGPYVDLLDESDRESYFRERGKAFSTDTASE